MSRNLSVITLAFTVFGMNSQGAVTSYSSNNFRISTPGSLNKLIANSESRSKFGRTGLEAPIPNPSPVPPQASAPISPEHDWQSSRTGSAERFEAPIPNPSPIPPALASGVSRQSLSSTHATALDLFEAPIPNPSPIPPEAAALSQATLNTDSPLSGDEVRIWGNLRIRELNRNTIGLFQL
jgi:hypothetical protein